MSVHESRGLGALTHGPSLPRGEWWARAGAALVFVVAAGFTLQGAHGMGGDMSMPGGWTLPMMWMVRPGESVWRTGWVFLVMWQTMMVAMMLPSTWPMLALYRRVALFRELPHPVLGTWLVGAGYFAVWLTFGAVAFAAGYGVSSLAMDSERISRLVPPGAGVALILAGLYQLTPLKQACLRHCREPVLYLSHAWRPGMRGAVRLGLQHGAFCAACCWALMLIQMVLGVMNLAVMIAIAAIIGTEKLWKRGPLLSRLVGLSAIAVGAVIIASRVR